MTSVIHSTAHGLVAGDPIYFGNVFPDTSGIVEGDTYYVLAAGLTANDFEFSTTPGGSPFVLANDITEGNVSKLASTYSPITDPADAMAPPTTPPTPAAPTVTSALVSGIVRLRVVLNTAPESKVRLWEVQITHKFTAGTADWSTPLTIPLPETSTECSIPALGSTNYVVRVRGVDVYGNNGSFSTEVPHTTLAGSDALAAAVADLANDVSDGIITETKIAPNSISTPKLQAGAVTAQILAATIVLTSLLKTSPVSTIPGIATGVAATDLITLVAHGLVVNDRVRFSALTGGTGLTTDVDYFVIASGLTADALKLSATVGGSAIDFTSDITAGTLGKVVRRVEIDTAGVRLLDVDDSIVVNIPTNGDPVYVKGQIDANSLISEASAEFRGLATLAASAIMTLNNGVAVPSAAPSVSAALLTNSLRVSPVGGTPVTAPPDVSTAAGIGYDSGSIWFAADPTQAGHYVAHEYSTLGFTLTRSILATGGVTTVTTTLGSTAHVADSAQSAGGGSGSQVATPLTIPGGLTNVKITKVAAYFAGLSSSPTCRTAVWSNGNTLLATSAAFSAANEGALGVGDSHLYNQALSSPLSATSGTTYRVGFLRGEAADFQWDRDDGAGKTTYLGDGNASSGNDDLTSVSTDSSHKPNVYLTYTYDVDTRLETAPMIGVAVDAAGGFIFTLDTLGRIWKYDKTTLAYIANSGVQTAITGDKTKAGLFYDVTAGELIITTFTGTGAGVFPKFVRVNKTTLAVSSTVYSAAAGTTFNGTTDTIRGGARVNDALNASAATYWVATTSAVYAYTFSGTTATQTANRDFGQAATVNRGLVHNGTIFLGYSSTIPDRVTNFTVWDWTTASSIYWFCYAWYDPNATGGTHETAVGPRTSLTMRRHERVTVGNPPVPGGVGTDDATQVRVYMKPNATDPGAGNFKLQSTDALTSRAFTDYASGGAADGAGTAFPAGTPGELKSSATGFSLKGDGSASFAARVTTTGFLKDGGTAFPATPTANDRFKRTDIQGGMWFFYDGTRWVSETIFEAQAPGPVSNTATAASISNIGWLGWDPKGGSDTWIISTSLMVFVNTGGTALGASHKWDFTIDKVNVATITTIATPTLASGANGHRTLTTAIGALAGAGFNAMRYNATKTGTPGSIYTHLTLLYRIVAT